MKNNFHDLLIFLTYIVVSCLFFWRVVFLGEVMFFGDTALQRVPQMQYWRESVLEGRVPLWNPHIFAGVPHLADLSTNTLSPFNLIYLIVPNAYQALSYLVVILVAIAGFGTFKYLMSIKLSKISSFIGGVMFAFSGTVLAAANDVNSLQGIAMIPLVMWATQKLIRNSTGKNINSQSIVLLVLILFLQFISGHPQYSYYTWIIVALYLLLFLRHKLKQRILMISLVFVLFFGLSAVQLLPFLELTTQTYRPKELSFSTENSVEILDLPQFMIGNFYGSWIEGNSWGPYAPLETGRANTEGYIGFFGIGLSFYAFYVLWSKRKNLSRKEKKMLFFSGLSLMCLIISMGSLTPIYEVLRKTLPLFSKFRSPIRLLSFYTFGFSVTVAYGFSLVSKKLERKI